MEEIWKAVPEYEGAYEVSNLGRVRGLDRVSKCKNYDANIKGKLLKNYLDTKGYERVSLNFNAIRKVWKVHQLVATVFLNHNACGMKISVDHINNKKTDNRASNLQLLSNRENCTKDRKNNIGLLGVSVNGNYYKARIIDNGKYLHLGTFKTPELAHEEYLRKRSEIEVRDLH